MKRGGSSGPQYLEHPSKASRYQARTFIVHPEARVEDCTVWAPLDKAPDGVERWEGLVGIRLALDKVRVCAVPVFADDLNLGDEVKVVGSAQGALVVTRVSDDAGNYTFRVYFEDGERDDTLWREILRELEPMECWFDVYSPSLLVTGRGGARVDGGAGGRFERGHPRRPGRAVSPPHVSPR